MKEMRILEMAFSLIFLIQFNLDLQRDQTDQQIR